MVADGAVPNTKTFTALIGSLGKMGSVGAALDIITELLGHDQGIAASASTYAALMAACEKAGQGDLALALFEKMKAQVRPCIDSCSPGTCYLLCMLTHCRAWISDKQASCLCRTCSLMLRSSTP